MDYREFMRDHVHSACEHHVQCIRESRRRKELDEINELVDSFFSKCSEPPQDDTRDTSGFFNAIFGTPEFWAAMNEPVTVRPIPGTYYSREKVIYAVRHYNKALPIRKGDINNQFGLARPARSRKKVNE